MKKMAGKAVVTIPWAEWVKLKESHGEQIRLSGGRLCEFIDKTGALHHVELEISESFLDGLIDWCEKSANTGEREE
jgi:hypothetical protein